MTIAIPFALLLIVVAIAWFVEAPREAKLIAQNMGGKDLDHTILIYRRVVNIGGVVLFLWGWSSLFPRMELWPALALLPCYIAAAWASFTITHRLRLNALRGLGWWYLSVGNAYDRFWIHRFGEWNRYDSVIVPRKIRKAAPYPYIFELTILAASIVGAIATLTNT